MSGCIAFLASQAGLANAKAKYSKLYESYKEEQEEANSCRLQSGLAVVPVKEYGEWLRDQPLSDNEIKVFRMYGVITSDEARDIKEKEELSR